MEATTVNLTARQLQVVRGLDHGKTQATISSDLGISLEATKAHLRAVRHKLGVGSSREVPHAARQAGLL